MTAFEIAAIPSETLTRVRAAAVDDFGNRLVVIARHDGGHPLRCCLRGSAPDEPITLIAHRPFPWNGVYAEVGPVFVHADECAGYRDLGTYPEGFRDRRQIFRAYGHDRTIVDAQVVDGAVAEDAIAALLARSEVDFVHSRNVTYGCFMFAIHRAAVTR